MGALALASGPSGALPGALGAEVASIPTACGALGPPRSSVPQYTAPSTAPPGDGRSMAAPVRVTKSPVTKAAKRKRSEMSPHVTVDARVVKIETPGCSEENATVTRYGVAEYSDGGIQSSHAARQPPEQNWQGGWSVKAEAAGENNNITCGSEQAMHSDLWLCGEHERSPFEEMDTEFLPF